MYTIKADGVVIYNPASDSSTVQVLSPRAEMKLGKAGSLTFTMLPDNVMYGQLQRMKSIVTLEQDGEIIFQGRVLDTVTDIDRHMEVYCEGSLAFLMDSAVRPYTYEGDAASLFYQLVAQHNAQVESYKQFTVGTVTAASGETLPEYDSDACANTLSEIKQMLVDPYGGYLRVRHSGSANYLDYIDAYGTSSGQTLEYGVNMVALEDAYELGKVYSVLVPLGAYYTEEDKDEEGDGTATASETEGETTEGETTEEEVDETIGEDGLKKKLKVAGVVTIEDVNGGSDSLIDSDMLAKYGRIVKAQRWENIEDPQELMDKGDELLSRNKDARSITIRAVDLHVINASVDSIRLGDNVRLVSTPHGLSLTDVCSAIDLDIENPEYSEYTFGVPPESLTEQNASASRRASYQNSSFLRWLTETDTSLNIAVQNVDLLNGKLTQVGIDVDALEGAVTIYAQRIDGLDTQMAELKVKYDEIYAKVENNEGDIAQIRIDIDSITAKVEDAEGKVASLELSLSDLESRVVLKAEYEEDKNAMLTMISNAEESIATLEANHGDRIAALELYTSDLESRVLLKAEYEENREADLKLIANAEESVATLEAKHGEQIAALELKATEQGSLIEAKADLILLDGYVKTTDLETEVITVLDSAMIDSISCGSIVSGNGDFDELWCGQINGQTFSSSTLTMGTTTATLFAPDNIDLSHSHKITDNGDGTFTLGEVSSTGGSFNIADTQYYKDGVSAARTEGINSVSLSTMFGSGGVITARLSNGKEGTLQLTQGTASGTDIPIIGNRSTVMTVDASDIYSNGVSAGYNSGFAQAISGATLELDGEIVYCYGPDGSAGPTLDISSGLTASYNSGYADASPASVDRTATYDSANNAYTVTAKVKAADGTTKDFDLVAIDASAAFDAGYADAVDSATLSVSGTSVVVTFSDGTTKSIDVKDYVTVTAGVTWSNPAQYYAMVRYWGMATMDGTQLGYTSASESKNISGYV